MISREEFLNKINEFDNLYINKTINKTSYKIKLAKFSKSYVNLLKRMSYSLSYISKLITALRKI